MATNTFASYLMVNEASSYEKLIDITDYPDLGADPDMLETTTLSDPMQTFIMGIQSSGALSFTANYDKASYTKIQEMAGKTKKLGLWFGSSDADGVTPDGHEGKFNFDGQVSVHVTGAGVNEVRKMTVTVAPSTPIKLAE